MGYSVVKNGEKTPAGERKAPQVSMAGSQLRT